MPVAESIKSLRGRKSNSTVEIVFKAENIPPLGFRSYFVAPGNDQLYSTRELPLADVHTIGDVVSTDVCLLYYIANLRKNTINCIVLYC